MKKYENSFLSDFFSVLEVKFSIYLNRPVFVNHRSMHKQKRTVTEELPWNGQ